MLRKRLIGVVTIKDNWAVQSFGYNRYLPIGKPECIVENLDRWGIDEILIQVIDRSSRNLGPDIDLLNKIARRKIFTPIVYLGGIASQEHAVEIIRAGADRICIDNLLHTNPKEVRDIANILGAQAIIAALPLGINPAGHPHLYNYITKKFTELDSEAHALIEEEIISEVMIIDFQNEGKKNGFDCRLSSFFSNKKIPLILFGGLSEADQLQTALLDQRVSAVAVGNFLNYQEFAVQRLKNNIGVAPIRAPSYGKIDLV